MAISTGSTITASDINNALSGKANSTHTHSGGDITSAVANATNATNATNADTLDGYHASSFLQASSYTASDVLTKIKTVDGSGSGLDADLLDGYHASSFALSSHTHTASNITNVGAETISTSTPSGGTNGDKWFQV